jgi:hypothetical protein
MSFFAEQTKVELIKSQLKSKDGTITLEFNPLGVAEYSEITGLGDVQKNLVKYYEVLCKILARKVAKATFIKDGEADKDIDLPTEKEFLDLVNTNIQSIEAISLDLIGKKQAVETSTKN